MEEYYFKETQPHAERAADEAIEMIRELHGIVISKPNLAGHYPKWKGQFTYSDFLFDPIVKPNGLVLVNGEKRFDYPSLFHNISHELGHTALFQFNPEIYENKVKGFTLVDEGVADHFKVSCSMERAKRERSFRQGYLSARRWLRNQVSGRLWYEPYSRGYRLVSRALTRGVSLKEIVENPTLILA